MPFGNPEEEQWHSAADLNELQNVAVSVGVAGGHAVIMEKLVIEKKQANI